MMSDYAPYEDADDCIAALTKERDRLRKALEFYAWPDCYTAIHGGRCAALVDRGQKAQAVLANTSREPK
jgi:hypothetical protein